MEASNLNPILIQKGVIVLCPLKDSTFLPSAQLNLFNQHWTNNLLELPNKAALRSPEPLIKPAILNQLSSTG